MRIYFEGWVIEIRSGEGFWIFVGIAKNDTIWE